MSLTKIGILNGLFSGVNFGFFVYNGNPINLLAAIIGGAIALWILLD